MKPGVLLTVFITVFLAELGDKTQIATLLFAADRHINRTAVFIAASAALIVATGLGVLVGSTASRFLDRRVLSIISGICFIAIGVWTTIQGLSAAS